MVRPDDAGTGAAAQRWAKGGSPCGAGPSHRGGILRLQNVALLHVPATAVRLLSGATFGPKPSLVWVLYILV